MINFVSRPLRDSERGGKTDNPEQGTPLSLEGIEYFFAARETMKSLELHSIPYLDSTEIGGQFSANTQWLFPGLQGTPYALIFDKDGKAQFQGHYTIGHNVSADEYYDKHFAFIETIARGGCNTP